MSLECWSFCRSISHLIRLRQISRQIRAQKLLRWDGGALRSHMSGEAIQLDQESRNGMINNLWESKKTINLKVLLDKDGVFYCKQ